MTRGLEHKRNNAIAAQVESYARAGIPVYIISKILKIDESVIKKNYTAELLKAEPDMIEQVANVAFMKAIEGNEKMIQLILSKKGAKYGWIEKQVIDNVNSIEELEALKQKLAKLEKEHEKDY